MFYTSGMDTQSATVELALGDTRDIKLDILTLQNIILLMFICLNGFTENINKRKVNLTFSFFRMDRVESRHLIL